MLIPDTNLCFISLRLPRVRHYTMLAILILKKNCEVVLQIVALSLAVHKRRTHCFKLISDNLVSVPNLPGAGVV